MPRASEPGFGDRIRAFRMRHAMPWVRERFSERLSARAVARRMGLEWGVYAGWERGSTPAVPTLQRALEKMEFWSPDAWAAYLITGVGAEPARPSSAHAPRPMPANLDDRADPRGAQTARGSQASSSDASDHVAIVQRSDIESLLFAISGRRMPAAPAVKALHLEFVARKGLEPEEWQKTLSQLRERIERLGESPDDFELIPSTAASAFFRQGLRAFLARADWPDDVRPALARVEKCVNTFLTVTFKNPERIGPSVPRVVQAIEDHFRAAG